MALKIVHITISVFRIPQSSFPELDLISPHSDSFPTQLCSNEQVS